MGGVSVEAWSKAVPGLRSLTTLPQERPSPWIRPPRAPQFSLAISESPPPLRNPLSDTPLNLGDQAWGGAKSGALPPGPDS